MAERNDSSGTASESGEGFEVSSAGDLYERMFEAYNSTQPSTRDLYLQMFSLHGIPTPRQSVQRPEGMVTLESNRTSQASTQCLYRQMFATHGVPAPHPPVEKPEGMVSLGSNDPRQTSTKSLYRQMFTTHGRPPPITFQGSAPTPASIPDLYRQMVSSHAEFPGDPAVLPTIEPVSCRAEATTQCSQRRRGH